MRYCPITRNCEFARAYARGKAYVHPYVVLYVNKNRVGHTRVGLTASKKVGNAVTRNRARRVMRAALSEVLRGDVGRYDIVLVARGITPKLKSTKLVPVLKKLLCDAGYEKICAKIVYFARARLSKISFAPSGQKLPVSAHMLGLYDRGH